MELTSNIRRLVLLLGPPSAWCAGIGQRRLICREIREGFDEKRLSAPSGWAAVTPRLPLLLSQPDISKCPLTGSRQSVSHPLTASRIFPADLSMFADAGHYVAELRVFFLRTLKSAGAVYQRGTEQRLYRRLATELPGNKMTFRVE